jgi:hypothetical protein
MGKLTDGDGVRDGNEEDSNEKFGDEHGDAGGFSTGWLVSSREICPRFYICHFIAYRHEKSSVGLGPCPVHRLFFAGLPT